MNEIFTRRSVRFFKPDPVEDEKLDRLLRAGMQAPSARNQQGWEFVAVRERARIEELSHLSPYTAPLGRAPLVLIVMTNPARLINEESAQSRREEMGAVIQSILLEAVHLGLGTVWCGVSPFEDRMANVRKACGIPEDIEPFAAIAVGYPEKEDANHVEDRYQAERVHWETY